MVISARKSAASAATPLVSDPWHAAAARMMKEYSERGVFRGQVDEACSVDLLSFKLRWHRNREFRIVLDRSKQIARVAEILPGLPAKSPMYLEYRKFLTSFVDSSRLPHRSVDAAKVRILPATRAGKVSLTLQVLDGDYQYALKKLLVLIHETYLGFLTGPYDMYRIEQLGADPDWGR